MSNPGATDAPSALRWIPSANFVMAAAFEGARAAILVSWVQRCATEPMLVSVAVRKGRPIEPIIRDSHAFALSLLAPDDRLVLRRISDSDEHAGNALDSIDCETLRTGSPCVRRAVLALDCEVARHIDLDADHELYIGLVVASKDNGAPTPARTGARSARERA